MFPTVAPHVLGLRPVLREEHALFSTSLSESRIRVAARLVNWSDLAASLLERFNIFCAFLCAENRRPCGGRMRSYALA